MNPSPDVRQRRLLDKVAARPDGIRARRLRATDGFPDRSLISLP
jgi:hypothetical protein